MTNKEILYFCYSYTLLDLSHDSYEFLEQIKSEREKNMVGRGSINILIDNLIYKLSYQHPGSSFTILKIVEKLKPN